MQDTIRLEVEVTETERATILLGFLIGSADLDDGRKLEITASGKIVRFQVWNKETMKIIKEYDLDLSPIAAAVLHR